VIEERLTGQLVAATALLHRFPEMLVVVMLGGIVEEGLTRKLLRSSRCGCLFIIRCGSVAEQRLLNLAGNSPTTNNLLARFRFDDVAPAVGTFRA
jgi:hypothetical protein